MLQLLKEKLLMIPSLTSRGSFLIAVCAVTASALAGPEFDEGGTDAGST